jgi:hypothetical protein
MDGSTLRKKSIDPERSTMEFSLKAKFEGAGSFHVSESVEESSEW